MFAKKKKESTAKAAAGARKPGAAPKRAAGAKPRAPKAPSKRRGTAPGSKPAEARGPVKTGFPRKPAPKAAKNLGIGPVEIAPLPGQAQGLGVLAAKAALDKKAVDVVVLDVRGVSGLCDEMVVASARSVTHLGAVCDAVEEALRLKGEKLLHADGRRGAEPDWILLDYGDLMVHLFRPEAREHTRLEDYYAAGRLVAKWSGE